MGRLHSKVVGAHNGAWTNDDIVQCAMQVEVADAPNRSERRVITLEPDVKVKASSGECILDWRLLCLVDGKLVADGEP